MDDLRDLYQEVILDHSKNPRNFRRIEGCDHHAEGDNPLCGDQLTVYLKMGEDGRVADVAFEGRGCAISTASASMMTELVRGRTEQEARDLFARFRRLVTGDDAAATEIGDEEAMERLMVLSGVRLFPMRVKCATLAWHTMAAAMDGKTTTTTE